MQWSCTSRNNTIQRNGEKMNKQFSAFFTATLVLLSILTGCSAMPGQVGQSSSISALASKPERLDPSAESTDTSAKTIDSEYFDTSAEATELGAGASVTASTNQETEIRHRTQELLSKMTQDEKLYQLFIVTQEQLTGVSQVTRSGETTRDAIERMPVGGVIYFERNIISPEQCSKMIENLQSYSKLGLFIAVDEEGGRVARLGNNPDMNTTAFPGGQAAIGKTEDPLNARRSGKTIGQDISRYGFNLNLAPVAEITDDTEHSVIGARSFGGDPDLVSEMVSEMVRGLHEGGVLCTLKHFPGHGDTTSDPHDGYTETSRTLEELRKRDFLPFQAGVQAGADFLMMGHFSAPQLAGDDVPATLSKDMIDLAKKELNFKCLIMTDSLSMGAITDRYSSGEAAVKALEAGADVILMPADLDGAMDGLKSALDEGNVSQDRIDESVEKILMVKLESGIIK